MINRPLRCVVVGEEALLIECTRILLARGHEVLAFVSPSEELSAWAEKEGLPTVPFDRHMATHLASLRFDYLFSIANLRMIPDAVLAMPNALAINFHDGLLPRHAGLFATSFAILDGDEQHGITWHVMASEADTGDILLQRVLPVPPGATVRDLDVACFDAGIDSFAQLLDALTDDTCQPTPQDLTQRTYHAKYAGLPDAGLFDWRRPAADLDAAVRATAFGRRRNELGSVLVVVGDTLLAITGAEVTQQRSSTPPGTAIEASEDALVVATGDWNVRLTSLVDMSGDSVRPRTLLELLERDHDRRFGSVTGSTLEQVAATTRQAHRHEGRWLETLRNLQPMLPPRFGKIPAIGASSDSIALPNTLKEQGAPAPLLALTAVLSFAARLSRGNERHVALGTSHDLPLTLVTEIPFGIPETLLDQTLVEATARVAAALEAVQAQPPYRRDLLVRNKDLAKLVGNGLPVAIALPETRLDLVDRALTIRIDPKGAVSFATASDLSLEHAAWLQHRFRIFVEAAARRPDSPLSALPLLSDEETRQLDSWNATHQIYPADRTVTHLIADVACAAPDAVALRFEDRQLSYAALDRASDAFARRLAALGASADCRVGIYLERSLELVVALLGVLKSGATYVPIDPIYPAARIEHMLRDSGARFVVTDRQLESALPAFPVERVLVGEAATVAQSNAEPFDRSDARAPAYVIYTSGSTGQPKGVQVGHRALVNFLFSMARVPGFSSEDTLLALTTICFDIAGLELYLPLVQGGTVDILPADVCADGFALRERIEQLSPSVLQATPTTWHMLLAAGWKGSPRLRALCGGEALSTSLADQLAARVGRLYNVYGPTETTIWSTVDEVRQGEPVTIGRPIANTRCHVVDERGMPVPQGIPGELYISGDGVAEGYFARPELTLSRFVPAPDGIGRAYRTGDLVRHLPDGRLEYLERLDGQIKLNGYRIELGEVESAIRKLTGVEQAVAVVRQDRRDERRLVAYVTGKDDLQLPELRKVLRDSLPAYMVPSAVVHLNQLPTTPNGKIDRKALPPPAPATTAAGVRVPQSDVERAIIAAWCEVLGLPTVGVDDNFFDLGGDSLKLTQVAALLRERLERTLSRLDMFAHPSVRAMAKHLSRTGTPEPVQSRRTRDVDALAQRRARTRRSVSNTQKQEAT